MKQILVTYDQSKELASQLSEIRKEWDDGQYKALLFHIFSAISDEKVLQPLSAGLKAEFPESDILGTVSAGEIRDARLMEPGILISAMFFELTEVRVVKYDDIKGNEEAIGKTLASDRTAEWRRHRLR